MKLAPLKSQALTPPTKLGTVLQTLPTNGLACMVSHRLETELRVLTLSCTCLYLIRCLNFLAHACCQNNSQVFPYNALLSLNTAPLWCHSNPKDSALLSFQIRTGKTRAGGREKLGTLYIKGPPQPPHHLSPKGYGEYYMCWSCYTSSLVLVDALCILVN